MINRTSFILIFFIMVNVSMTPDGLSSVWKKLQRDPCSENGYKLLSLLNLLCNTTQVTNLTTRDACYGCFFRAGNQPTGPSQLQALNDCANLYINGTAYSTCAVNLNLIVNGTIPTQAPTTVCYSGYCEFVRCVRRINANILISGCIQENVGRFDLTQPLPRVYFYSNVTACILARARCNPYNPVSGILQQPNTAQYAYGDLRIITFPNNIGIGDLFCSRSQSLNQAPYNSLTC
ncbi:uncharacterized protein LOC129612055 isoform X2 [Condylostylus longicornis]|uniref:uncharacterized protein LOC129612055 isoform X2 n=1 Tax=Condylostylus longicornis TaxID=2530218 RepID=UPI00244E038B|nr:uncharacterized protein LOC129612055 isoform X2 [Condylostylus longicornis]